MQPVQPLSPRVADVHQADLAQDTQVLGHQWLHQVERGDQVELVVSSRWQSMQAIQAFAGASPEKAVVEPAARAVLTRFDDFVTHYDVVLEASGT